MRALGTVFLILGIVFLVLLVVLVFTGDTSPTSLIAPVVLITSGLRFRNWGRGILRDTPSSGASSVSASSQGAGSESAQAANAGTVEIPMTPQAADAIARQSARLKKQMGWLTGGALVVFLGIAAFFSFVNGDRQEARVLQIIFVSMGLGLALLLGGIQWLFSVRPVVPVRAQAQCANAPARRC